MDQFKQMVKDIPPSGAKIEQPTKIEEKETNLDEYPLVDTSLDINYIQGLTPNENRDLEGVLNPPESVIGGNGDLHFQEMINKTEEQLDKTTDEAERISSLEEACDKVIEKKELEESHYRMYTNLYKSNTERLHMVQYGVVNKNLRKLILNDDSGASNDDTQKVADKLMYDVYSNNQKICLDWILKDHGLYAPHQMNNNFKYVITLPESQNIMKVQLGQTVGEYSLEKLQLGYETINNIDLAQETSNLYSVSRLLSYEHVIHIKKTKWSSSSMLINKNINVTNCFYLDQQILQLVKILYIQTLLRSN